MTDTPRTDAYRALRKIGEDSIGWCAFAESLERELVAAVAERDALGKELDEASPKQKCDRCGKEFRWHQMTVWEGDEWECFPCNERENARERAAMKEKP